GLAWKRFVTNAPSGQSCVGKRRTTSSFANETLLIRMRGGFLKIETIIRSVMVSVKNDSWPGSTELLMLLMVALTSLVNASG
ncbi:MAG: hypothetical protein ACK53V_22155, partial [Planctomycetota bacterium]